MSFIAKRMDSIDSSGIRKVFNLAAKLKDPINLSIGQPAFDVPDPIKNDMVTAINEGYNKYTLTQGDSDLRAALIKTKGNDKYTLENVMVTSGVSGGLVLAFMTLVNPGEEVMIFDPYFVMYPHLCTLAGGVPKFVDINPDFKITKEKLENAYSPKVKALVINTPANPTGMTITKEEAQTIAAFARAHNIVVISDEIYDDFVYDGEFASVADYYENTLVLNGFSKNFAMTGLRLGYAFGPEEIISRMITLQQYTFVCAPSIAQKGVIAHLDNDFSATRDAYRRKRDIAYEGLKDAFDVVKPTGAFYAFVRLKSDERGSAFVERAIKNNVLIIPSSAFSASDNGFRVSFAQTDEKLQKGVAILASLT